MRNDRHYFTSNFQWQYRSKSIYYLIYRWLIAIFFVTCVMVSMSHIASWYDFGMYFIFMTNWGIWTCLVAGTFGAVLVTLWYFDPKFSGKCTDLMLCSFKQILLIYLLRFLQTVCRLLPICLCRSRCTGRFTARP